MKKKYLFMILFIVIVFLSISNPSYAGSQKMKNLAFDVVLNEDGSMDVTENWNIRVSNTNTLFKTFQMDSSKYSGITNVIVEKDIGNNETRELKQIYSEMYHVTKDCFYALKNKDGKFEIAWGVGLDNSTQTVKYKISYKVLDAVKVYNDCTELYWQFLGTDNGIPVDKLTGTIKLPSAVKNIDNLRIWAHGPLNGEIQKIDNSTVKFTIDDLADETMVEVRLVTQGVELFTESTNRVNQNKFDSIIAEETEWADEANQKRDRARFINNAINIGSIVVALFLLTRFFKVINKIKNKPKLKPEVEYEYFRDIPDENATPGEAAFLYYFQGGRTSSHMGEIFSATILNFSLKKVLEFEQIPGEKVDDLKIKLNMEYDISNLKQDEAVIYSKLVDIARMYGQIFTIKDLRKYMKNHSESFVKALDRINDKVKEQQVTNGNYDEKNKFEGAKYSSIAGLYFFAAIFIIFFGFTIAMGVFVLSGACILNAIAWSIYASRFSGITQKGIDEQSKWKGLKKFMIEYSLLKEREVVELVLWEKYLVYATAFGVADKVMAQLKIAYPQLSQDELIGNYAYMHYMTHNRQSFITDLNKSMVSSYQRAYTSTYSSGSGAGGGFSGGGGGRRRRRPEWAEDNK